MMDMQQVRLNIKNVIQAYDGLGIWPLGAQSRGIVDSLRFVQFFYDELKLESLWLLNIFNLRGSGVKGTNIFFNKY